MASSFTHKSMINKLLHHILSVIYEELYVLFLIFLLFLKKGDNILDSHSLYLMNKW